MRRRVLFPVMGLLATSLTACNDSGSLTTPDTFNLQAGYAYLVSGGQTSPVTLSGNVLVNGVSTAFMGTGTLTLSPSTAATFNGAPGMLQTESISGTVTAAGQNGNYASSVTNYYTGGMPALLGETSVGEYDVAQSPFNYPTMVVGGSSGILGTLNRYTDSTMGVSLGTVQVSYSVLMPTDPIGTVQQRLVDITATVYDIQNTLVETDVTTYNLTSTGTMIFTGATTQNASGNLSISAP